MARESEPLKGPLTPRKSNDQHPKVSNQPEFGKPSPLRPVHNSANLPFNIPKANQARPEHHRPAGFGQQRPPQASVPNASAPYTQSAQRSQPFDPFKPVIPSAYNAGNFRPTDRDAVQISRPENVLFDTPRSSRPLYSSKPVQPVPLKMSTGSKTLQHFIDLTAEGGFSPSIQPYNRGFGSIDVDGYVDIAKANEDVKALLEGAFEDEEDKERAKQKRSKNRKGKKKSKEGSQKESSQKQNLEVDDLAAQLGGVKVSDSSNIDKADQENTKPANSRDPTGTEKEEEDVSEAEEGDEEDDGTVEGLKAKLLPHQREGTDWMRDKEIGQNRVKGVLPKGGILADDMGLGKTVQAIALILTNRKPKDQPARKKRTSKDSDTESEASETKDTGKRKFPPGLSKCTLVVAPLALIKQWESEIDDKVERSQKLRVCVYHGASRSKDTGRLEDYDVVITTYGTLTSEHGGKGKSKDKDKDKDNKTSDKKSGLFSVYWYRVILDEAHTIKNRNAKATQAACALDAEYRWCLTGTPMQNNLDELQSLIKFLRIKPFDDLATWKDQISRPLANGRGGLAIQRLQVYLKAFMKRRTKDVLKLNDNLKPEEETDSGQTKPSGFQITKREVIQVSAEFSPGELNFYKRLEQRTENSLKKMMGDSKIDYAGALVLLLRLRQCCNHPDLVRSDLAKDKDILLQGGSSQSQQIPGEQDGMDSMAALFGGLSVVSKKCDVCQMELSKEEAKSDASRCRECEADFGGFAGPRKPKQSTKGVVDLTESPPKRKETQTARSRRNRRVVLDSDDEEDGEWIVPEDQRDVPDAGTAGGWDDENAEGGGEWLKSDDSDTDEDDTESPGRKPRNVSSQATDSEDDIYSDPDDDDDDDHQVFPSTKIRRLMKILRVEAAEHKFIVFSVFTSMLDKVEPFLKRAGIGFARYDGSMRNDLREANLNNLRKNRGTRVLLCSLRAGALGLNLTAASRVVILEPFWNPFVEEQAIDRVHRLNQTQDVKVYKMIIDDTVEQRILDLQNRKRELANVTIEGKGAAAKLTMKDMLGLFGQDAESRYMSKQGDIDFTQATRLLSSNDEGATAFPATRAGLQGTGVRGRQVSPSLSTHRPTTEDPVYGRRW